MWRQSRRLKLPRGGRHEKGTRVVFAAFLATPFVLVAQTPTPTRKVGADGGSLRSRQELFGVPDAAGPCPDRRRLERTAPGLPRQNDALKKQLKSRANELEVQVRQLEAAVDKADENKKSVQDRNRAMKDSIRKILDQIAEMRRATSFSLGFFSPSRARRRSSRSSATSLYAM